MHHNRHICCSGSRRGGIAGTLVWLAVLLLLILMPVKTKAGESVNQYQEAVDSIKQQHEEYLQQVMLKQSDALDQAESFAVSMGGVVTAFALIMMGLCAYKWVFAATPESAKQAKTWFITIISGIAIYWLVSVIISAVIIS